MKQTAGRRLNDAVEALGWASNGIETETILGVITDEIKDELRLLVREAKAYIATIEGVL